MALKINETFQSETTPVKDGAHVTERRTVMFASGAGTLPKLCPVAFNTATNLWVPLTHGGLNGTDTVKGFLWPDPLTLDGASELLGVVAFAGELNFGDLNTAAILAATGKTVAQLKTSLRTGLRELNLTITGLDQVR